MADPELAAATLPGDGDGFDIDEFLLDGGTLYMIAKAQGEDCSLAPVFAALANEIQYRATQLGSQMPGGRLDPPLRHGAGRGHPDLPGPAAPVAGGLRRPGRPGLHRRSTASRSCASAGARHGAQTILDTTSVRMYLGGLADDETLRQATALCGTAPCRERGQDTWTRADVMTPAMLRELPARLRAADPRPALAGDRQAGQRLEGPRLQARPPRRLRRRPAGPRRRARARPGSRPRTRPASWTGRRRLRPAARLRPGCRPVPDRPPGPAAVGAGRRRSPPIADGGPGGRRGAAAAARRHRPTRGAPGDPAGRAATGAGSGRRCQLDRPRLDRRGADQAGPGRSATWPSCRPPGRRSWPRQIARRSRRRPAWTAVTSRSRRRAGGRWTTHARAEAVERIASWVDQVFRPGYGHLAARLGPCWREHTLCLYLLDWLVGAVDRALHRRRAQPRAPGQPGRAADPDPARRRRPAANARPTGCEHAPRPGGGDDRVQPGRAGRPTSRRRGRGVPAEAEPDRPRAGRAPGLANWHAARRVRPRGHHAVPHRPAGRSAAGGRAPPTPTWRSPPARRARTSWTSTCTPPVRAGRR